MAKHGSATREETPHVLETSRTNTLINVLKRRALAVLNDESIDARSRAIIRHGLETNDPWLAEFVRRAEAGERKDAGERNHPGKRNEASSRIVAGEKVADTLDCSLTPEPNEGNSDQKKIEALAEIICRAGDESAGALFVLMGTLQNSTHPQVLANTAKHFAFTCCGEFNIFGMV